MFNVNNQGVGPISRRLKLIGTSSGSAHHIVGFFTVQLYIMSVSCIEHMTRNRAVWIVEHDLLAYSSDNQFLIRLSMTLIISVCTVKES